MKQYSGLKLTGQIRMLKALADRGDKAARPLVTEAVTSAEAEIRAAVPAALGKAGDASSAPVLAESAAGSPDGDQPQTIFAPWVWAEQEDEG